jgi:hypothetical protein
MCLAHSGTASDSLHVQARSPQLGSTSPSRGMATLARDLTAHLSFGLTTATAFKVTTLRQRAIA